MWFGEITGVQKNTVFQTDRLSSKLLSYYWVMTIMFILKEPFTFHFLHYKCDKATKPKCPGFVVFYSVTDRFKDETQKGNTITFPEIL